MLFGKKKQNEDKVDKYYCQGVNYLYLHSMGRELEIILERVWQLYRSSDPMTNKDIAKLSEEYGIDMKMAMIWQHRYDHEFPPKHKLVYVVRWEGFRTESDIEKYHEAQLIFNIDPSKFYLYNEVQAMAKQVDYDFFHVNLWQEFLRYDLFKSQAYFLRTVYEKDRYYYNPNQQENV